MCCYSATGMEITPTMVLSHELIPKNLAAPPKFRYLKSETGWMTEEVFTQWLEEVFAPAKGEGAVILFLNGDASHLGLKAIDTARMLGVHLYLFPTKATHCLQPLTVGPFDSLRLYWREEGTKYSQQYSCEIDRRNCAIILRRVLNRITKASVKKGFKKCGIFPLNAKAPDYSNLVEG